MTEQSLFGIAGPFTVASPLASVGNGTPLTDKVRGTNLVLPAGSIITEVQIQKRGDNTTLLTAGKSVAVGVSGNARVFTGTPGALTDNLNTGLENYQAVKLNPTDISGMNTSYTTNQTIVVQCALGVSITSGSVAVVIKYKPYSKSVAKRF